MLRALAYLLTGLTIAMTIGLAITNILHPLLALSICCITGVLCICAVLETSKITN